MASYGKTSTERLATTHPLLQKVFNEVVKKFDNTIVCGHRSVREQEEAFSAGKSKVRFGKHNIYPSLAVDAAPWPLDWNDLERFTRFGFYVMGVAAGMGVPLRWGRDWDGDFDLNDQKFNDFPHFELVRPICSDIVVVDDLTTGPLTEEQRKKAMAWYDMSFKKIGG